MLIGETPVGELPGIGDSFSVLTKSYDMDMWLIFTGSEPLEGGAIRYSLNRSYDVLLNKSLTKTYSGLIGIGRNDLSKTFRLDTSLLKPLISYSPDIILRPSYDSTIPATTVIDALVWSWVEILDAVWRQMDTMANALKLEHATGDDLENAWGQIYELPRIKNEDDTAYRDRLKTRTRILNSSGTKANCELILNNVVGSDDANVDTQYPSHVKITFDSVDSMRIANGKLTTLNILIPQMLASGISYDLLLPYIDYLADIIMNGPIWLPYNNYLAIKHRNTDSAYDFYFAVVSNAIISITSDIELSKWLDKSFIIGNMVQNFTHRDYTSTIGLFGTFSKTFQKDILISKLNILKPYIMDSYFKDHDLEKYMQIDLVSKITKKRLYRLENSIVFHNTASYDFDIVSRLYLASIDMDILSRRDFPNRVAMRTTLVGA